MSKYGILLMAVLWTPVGDDTDDRQKDTQDTGVKKTS